MNIKRKYIAVALLGAIIGFAQIAKAEDIKIGGIFAMSGTQSALGEQMSSGANLAVEHVNADRILSSNLRLVIEDAQALPQKGVIAMNKLVNVDKVPYVLTTYTGVSKAISPIAHKTKTVVVNGGATGQELAELGPYFWNIIPLVNEDVKALASYLTQEKNIKRWTLVYLDDLMGQNIKKELEVSLPKNGAQLVAALSIPVNQQQFGSIAALVRESKPDVVFLASYGAQQVALLKQLRDNGISQPMASYTAFSNPEILSLPEAKGSFYTAQHYDWTSKDPVTKRFVDDYKIKNGKNPAPYVANYYNGVRLFALLASGLEKKGKQITGENLLEERKSNKELNMVGGKMTFRQNGTIKTPMDVLQIGDGGVPKILKIVNPED